MSIGLQSEKAQTLLQGSPQKSDAKKPVARAKPPPEQPQSQRRTAARAAAERPEPKQESAPHPAVPLQEPSPRRGSSAVAQQLRRKETPQEI